MEGGFRWGDLGVIAAIICNIIIGTWEIAHLDGRVGAVEKEQLRDETRYEVALDALQTYRGNSDVHFTKLDGAVDEMKGNVGTILDILNRMKGPVLGEDTNNNQNFHRPK